MKFVSLRKNNYPFDEKTLCEQTENILRGHGVYLQSAWRVTSEAPSMTDACQFDETNFNHLSQGWKVDV